MHKQNRLHRMTTESGISGTFVGASLGATLGLIITIGMLAIYGQDSMTTSGPIIGLIAGMVVGSVLGWGIGALLGRRSSEYKRHRPYMQL